MDLPYKRHTRIPGYRIWVTCKEAKRGDQREKMPKGTASTARAKGGVEGHESKGGGHKQRAEQRREHTGHRGRGEGRASANTSTSTSTGAPHSGRELEVGNNPKPGRYSRDIKKPRARTKKKGPAIGLEPTWV
jgi:hypothetical protein